MGTHWGSALSPRSSDAETIADLWWLMVGLGAVAFAVFAVGLFTGLRRASAEGNDDRRRLGRQEPTSVSRAWILGGGVALPTVLIAVVLVATVVALQDVAASDDEAEMSVEVIGHRFWWEVRYPDHGVVTANEVHIPAETEVEIVLRSADVIHSFWVPAVAGKMDLLPERTNRLVIAAEPGRYRGSCAEFCGVSHANMDFLLVAHGEGGFDTWLAEQAAPAREPSTAAAARGAELFVEAGCASCHTVAGTDATGEKAPDLTHFASRDSILGGAADPTAPDLVDWITDPHTVKPGTDMPAADLSEDQIDDLVAYLGDLR